MHYALVGPGALGSLLACTVVRGLCSEDRFTILDHREDRAEYFCENGITYESETQITSFPVVAVSEPGKLDHVDVVILCVKSYDVESSLEFCTPILGRRTLLLFMQNGIRHLAFGGGFQEAVTAFGTTTEGATRLGQGHVRHAGRGLTHLGFPGAADEEAKVLLKSTADLLQRGGVQTELSEDIITRLWAKLFINVGINALTAIFDCKNGELLTIGGVAERMQSAVNEAVQVALSKRINIDYDPVAATRNVCQKTAANVSSMLQDVRNKRKTEIAAINGAVVEVAKELGIETPENQRLVNQVREIERNY